ncbi:hypothetical protein [Micromonospora chalcea]|uniref:hypothetical protein n=1 Tax=Micromonospora chalcea TaxID=1874 RepID=UPI0033D65BA6
MSFQIVADGSTSMLLIHPDTGDLLAATEWINGGRRPGLHSYTLLLAHAHTRNTDMPTSPTTAAAVTRLR